MKKGLTFVFITLILVATFVSAQSVTIEDFKAVLITAIQSYFSNTPVVTVEELKDLIVAYLTTSGDVVDLLGFGKFSGEKLIDIYNKAKGVVKGEYTDIMKTAVKLDQPTPKWDGGYGFYSGPSMNAGSYTIPQGATVWFLIDPKGFTGVSNPNFKISFIDFAQGSNLKIWMYTIDSSDNLIGNPAQIPLATNTYAPWGSFGQHTDEKRYLIKVVEDGTRPTPYSLYWWFD